jgi:hypothetical protein
MDEARLKADPIALHEARQQALKRPQMHVSFRDQDRLYETDPREVVLQPLTLSQELDAERATDGQSGGAKIVEQLKRAIVSVDGRKLDAGRAEHDQFLEACSPQVRRRLEASYLKLAFGDGKLDDFLASQTKLVL